jgi:hypothetical protein
MGEGLFQGLWLLAMLHCYCLCRCPLQREVGQREARLDGVSHLELLVQFGVLHGNASISAADL